MDLSKLTIEEKRALLDALQKKALLKQERALETTILHPKQKEFHENKKPIRLFLGGNASGKTFSLVHELAHTHLKTHPFRDVSNINKTWWYCVSLAKVVDYIDLLKKLCPPSQFPDIDKMGTSTPRRLIWKNGGTTTFFSYDQDTMSSEGTSFDACFFDEPPPRSAYVAAFRGLRSNPDHFVCIAMTALSEPWIYSDLYLKSKHEPDGPVFSVQTRTTDNMANIDAAWFKEFSESLTEDEKAVRLEGGFQTLQGRVFTEFDRRIHVIETKPFPQHWPVYVCIDPHTRKPSTALWIGVTKDNELIVLNETKAKNIQELGDMIQYISKKHSYRVVSHRIDNSGSSNDWSDKTAVDILREKCNLKVVPVTNEEKSFDDSVFLIRQLLKPEKLMNGELKPRLFFMQHCRETITEMEMYGWRNSRNPESSGLSDKVKKINDDFIDPLRYIVMSKPRHNLNFEPISYSDGYTKKARAGIWGMLSKKKAP